MIRPHRGHRIARCAAAITALVLAGTVAACSSGSSTSSEGTTRATTTGAGSRDACPPAPADAPTSGRQQLTSGGVERSYVLHVPDDADRPAPLIVGLHGFNGSGAGLDASTLLGGRGAAAGAIVALPDGLGTPARWNFDRRAPGPDDYAFIGELLDHLEDQLCIDPDRVFVAGSSNGAAFAGLLACTEPYRFAAVAMVIATVPSTCPDSVTPAVLTIRGTADPHVRFPGAPQMVAGIAQHAACGTGPEIEHPADGVDRTRYTRCRDGSEVVLDAVVGGVHRWPGGTGTDPEHAGYDATDQILAFFERHPAPP